MQNLELQIIFVFWVTQGVQKSEKVTLGSSYRCRTDVVGVGLAGLAQTAGAPSACCACRTLDASGHDAGQTSCISVHMCLEPAMGSQWLRVLLKLLYLLQEHVPHWDSGIPLRTLRSSPARPQLVVGPCSCPGGDDAGSEAPGECFRLRQGELPRPCQHGRDGTPAKRNLGVSANSIECYRCDVEAYVAGITEDECKLCRPRLTTFEEKRPAFARHPRRRW